jgi:hypothetical protein
MERPTALARELANAADNEAVREVIFREAGSALGEELQKYGTTTLPLDELSRMLGRDEDSLKDARPMIYGRTPMRRALEEVRARFSRELASAQPGTVPVLFIISDGEPTDGDPAPVAESIRKDGIYIVSCFITNKDLPNARSLREVSESTWDPGASLMFRMASDVSRDSVFTRFLSELGWAVPARPKLFVQVNHSQVFDEFMRLALSPLVAARKSSSPLENSE